MKNILILSKNYSDYSSGYYYQDLIEAFQKFGNIFLYGDEYFDYNKNDTIEDVISKSPWNKNEIDLIIASISWENQSLDVNDSDPHPKINLSSLKIPKIFFLNKEYLKIKQKIEYIKDNKFDMVVTTLPEERYKKWEDNTKTKFVQSHFGVNLERFRFLNLKRTYDITFSGSLHKQHNNKRFSVKKELFKIDKLDIKSNKGIWRLISIANPLKEEYQKYNIYWVEWSRLSRNLLGKKLPPFGQEYVKLLNRSKTFLNTLSAKGIFNTKFFELMATKTLIFCPEDNYYGLLKDGENCLMFKNDLSDFKEKLKLGIENKVLREKIIENAYKEVKKHSYEQRLKDIFNLIKLA